MATPSAFTPKASLTEAPTNLKEAIDWVLRVTGKDGKKNGECICGLAAAVTDLLQSVQLEYNGYEGDVKNGTDTSKGANSDKVKEHLNGLFSLVQGLGGTAVVRTYIDQLAQVLSALVGWSSIKGCKGNGGCKGGHGSGTCKYLNNVTPNDMSCTTCKCIKWTQSKPGEEGVSVGRGCTRCKDSSVSDCMCTGSGGSDSCTAETCKCAKEGKCCKCCCKGQCGNCKKECSCIEEEGVVGRDECNRDSYMSAYPSSAINRRKSFLESEKINNPPSWKNLEHPPPGSTINSGTITDRRHQCARILLGSVCLIWSGITYMYWTGKWAKSSPRWNNHILDGSGLDDGTLSQWLQALGFPREMLNNSGPGNRLDAVIWDGIMEKLFLGFKVPSGSTAKDHDDNTAKNPAGMNCAGFVHTIHRDSFNSDATVFPKDGSGSSSSSGSVPDQHKRGALFKLYILSCAYFTGLQKRNSESATASTYSTTPRTIREILYWLSALPYSHSYKQILTYGKDRLEKVLKKPGETETTAGNEQKQLKFYQDKRPAPITVDEYNLFAHFQAVTQYCPLVLIGIQGGLNSTKGSDRTREPAIHSLYANTECNFTYPEVSIQAYNQVVHYIRGLFYQLYFLRKQCAVKVALGGKWRECRYGKDVVSKGVISWMCLGCNPMEHDRKCRVEKVKGVLETVLKGKSGQESLAEKVKELLIKIGDVVVQLGNAQEALEGRKGEEITKVKAKLQTAKAGLEKVNNDGLNDKLKEAKAKLEDLAKNGGGGKLKDVENALGTAASDVTNIDPGKNKISEAIKGVRDALEALKKVVEGLKKEEVEAAKGVLGEEITGVSLTDIVDVYEKYSDMMQKLQNVTNDLLSICTSPKCPSCKDHKDKCGKRGEKKTCPTCHQQYMDGFPSPLQAFLEDRLPGFSCQKVVDDEKENPDYPAAADHLGHCNGSGQCCPLPMGFRGNFHSGSTSDMTGSRLYGILYFFSNENMMQSCVYTLVRVTAALSATTPQVLGDVFGFFRGGVGNKDKGKTKSGGDSEVPCQHTEDPKTSTDNNTYFCGWCASGLRDVVNDIEWIPKKNGDGGQYRETVGTALIKIKGDKDAVSAPKSSTGTTTSNLSTLTTPYLSPLTGELYTAVSATFGGTYLSWVLYLSDALHWGLESLASAFQEIECRGCKGNCDPNKCKKGHHGSTAEGSKGTALCQCSSIVSCTGVLPVLYRHGFSYGNPFNLEGYKQKDGKDDGQYDIENKKKERTKHCHQFLESLQEVINKKQATSQGHPLTNLLSQVGKLQYDIRLPWIFVLTLAWLVAVLYLAFGAIWPLDWTHMRSHWLRGGEHQWQCMWYKVMTGRKGMELVEYFGRK